MNYIVFNSLFKGICFTTEQNYHARIWDERKIQSVNDCESKEECKQYMIDYLKIDKNAIEIE